ncbi:MAG: glycosyltransferase family 4 protein [Drouetiella hepatica Uher 2000/2452]|jgi:glycosyltransferase involved in cell wall biosynthesis|uniref:Glycosyltransferase family 4 protein n=1 Tax=Drouetiella hepatica Uher 2000/2452 TaxID=904376 RepID=A0A951Q9S8_9CYAN|nr:glycosyltransferase family 4 protein [Drouetiella hepatica Uher 2000/2452]
MTRIAIISTMQGSPWGGSEELWSAMATVALEDGHSVITSTFRWPAIAPHILQLQQRGAKLLFQPRPKPGVLGRIMSQFNISFNKLFRFQPDVLIINQGATYDPLIMKLGNLFSLLYNRSIPYIVICHRNEDSYIPSDAVRAKAIQFFENAASVLFVAEHNLRTTERQLARKLSNAQVVRNPVNLITVGAIDWPILETVNFANVARLDVVSKGQDSLFEALSGVIWQTRNWQLNLYGGGNSEYLQTLAYHYGIGDRVKFHGHVQDVRKIWSTNHCLILPSKREGTPISLVEAMLCGRPAIVTDVGGNIEWVEEALTGFIAEAPTVRSLTSTLERAWQAQSIWETMGTQAHKVALSKFDRDPGRTLLKIVLSAALQQAAPLSSESVLKN